ncbi:hypothetical protein EZS27_035872, partial [termite gut metagenome]
MPKMRTGATLFFCTDACLAAVIGKLNSNHKWELFEMSKVLGMGNAKYKNQLGIYKLDEFDEVIPYNSFSGVSYIGICKNKKWGLIKITEDENSTLLKFDCNFIEDVNYTDIKQLEEKYSQPWINGIKDHLSTYKSGTYKDIKDGQYNYKGNIYYYPHIFPRICGNLNLLETYRDDFLKSDLSKINFHRYFHHLNSSQAMCINFFYPLIKEEKRLINILRCYEKYRSLFPCDNIRPKWEEKSYPVRRWTSCMQLSPRCWYRRSYLKISTS